MSDETVTEDVDTDTQVDDSAEIEKQAFLARLKKESAKAKEAEKRAADLAKQLEEREAAGLPELDQLKKRLEQAEKRAEEADQRAQQADTALQRAQKERWVTAAAKDFDDPSDALAFLNLDDLEDAKDAERAVKNLAKQKPRLLKDEDPKLPGRVLENGRAPSKNDDQARSRIDPEAESSMLAAELAKFANNWVSAD